MAKPNSRSGSPPAKIYISYSHRDKRLFDGLLKHLQAAERSATIELFHDRVLEPGADWSNELLKGLEQASIVLFLVSQSSLTSSFIERELNQAISRDKRIIPVLLEPCDWFGSPLSKFQALPRNGKPITTWNKRDEAFAEVAAAIVAVSQSVAGGRNERLPRSHSGAIRRIAIAPDGARMVSASSDGVALVWDLTSMQTVTVLEGHDGELTDVAITGDGRVITSSKDWTIRIWSLDDGSRRSTLEGGKRAVVAIAVRDLTIFSTDGSTMRLWNSETGEMTHEVQFKDPFVTDIVAGSQPATVVTVDAVGQCRDMNYLTGSLLMKTVASAPINEIHALPDGVNYATCCENGSVQVFNLRGEVREFALAPASISGLGILPDGHHAVAACADGTVKLFSLADGAVIREARLGTGVPTAVAVTPDGKRAVWGTSDGSVSAWPLETSVQTLPVGRDRLKIAYLAVLELPELWRVLETFDEAAVSAIAAQLSAPPSVDLLEFLTSRHPNQEPPPLWYAWMETVHQAKLGASKP
jgi:WD40 repeat protein